MEEQNPNQITVVNLILPPTFLIIIGLASQIVAWISSTIVLSRWRDEFGLFHDLTLLDVLKNIFPQLVWFISFGVFSLSIIYLFKLKRQNYPITRNLNILILFSLITLIFSPLNFDYYSDSLPLVLRDFILITYNLILFFLLLLSVFIIIRSKSQNEPIPEYIEKIFILTTLVFVSLVIVSYFP